MRSNDDLQVRPCKDSRCEISVFRGDASTARRNESHYSERVGSVFPEISSDRWKAYRPIKHMLIKEDYNEGNRSLTLDAPIVPAGVFKSGI